MIISSRNKIQAAEAVAEAKAHILRGIQEDQLGLLTRWSKVNRAIPGGFQFNNNTLIAGLSGHGKSFILNMIRDDFLNKKINHKFAHDFDVLFFTFEMSAADEMLRTLQGKVQKDYADLLSLRRKLSRAEYEECARELDILAKFYDRVTYIQVPSNKDKMKMMIDRHIATNQKRLIVMLDHTLLLTGEENEVTKLAEYAKMMIELRQEYAGLGIMTFSLGQMKEQMKDMQRTARNTLHYPTNSDIFGSKQMYHAMDTVIVVNQPALYNLPKYGPLELDTEFTDGNTLLAFHILKQRKGESNILVTLEADLRMGRIIERLDPKSI